MQSLWVAAALLLASPAGWGTPAHELVFERVNGKLASGDQRWRLQVRQGPLTVASWPAASGTVTAQRVDRRWSPGNGAPLPMGVYGIDRPEAWGGSWWIALKPRFATSRSALGIHTCLPGTGCICLPSKADTDAVARWISTKRINVLKVIN
ncbi:hypothetical protein KBY58_04740 [Cyanobium sp. HWJ4-Hawea]|uniref:hypothetical protein n=1 Tax=Cyanobium sp. HWJ4-Hawea TaxID=2823713 RepID=UPI0020CBAAA3|nr:hypothetical protein [Cyanobium sp. HWJ4-Hawea]MCP9808737.1 hypothetical protein [Cyanobium sp. HWJ4-Hawea]